MPDSNPIKSVVPLDPSAQSAIDQMISQAPLGDLLNPKPKAALAPRPVQSVAPLDDATQSAIDQMMQPSSSTTPGSAPTTPSLAQPEELANQRSTPYAPLDQRATPYSAQPPKLTSTNAGAPDDMTKFAPMRDVVELNKQKESDIQQAIQDMPDRYRPWATKRSAEFMADKAGVEYEIANTKNIKAANELRDRLRLHEIAYLRDIEDARDEGQIESGKADTLPFDKRAIRVPPEATEAQAKKISEHSVKYVMSPMGDVYLKGQLINVETVAKTNPALAHFLAGGATATSLVRGTGVLGRLEDLTGNGQSVDDLLSTLKDRSEDIRKSRAIEEDGAGQGDETRAQKVMRKSQFAVQRSMESMLGIAGIYIPGMKNLMSEDDLAGNWSEDTRSDRLTKTIRDIAEGNFQHRKAVEWHRSKDPVTRKVNEFYGGVVNSTVSPFAMVARAVYADDLADSLNQFIRGQAAATPEDERTFADDLANGLGSVMASYIQGRVAGNVAQTSRGAKFVTYLVASELEAASEANDTYNSMISQGASPEEARTGMWRTFGANAVLNPLLDKIGIFNAAAGKSLKRILKAHGAEGVQEGAQQVIQNLVQGDSWYKGVGESMLIGSITGGMVKGGEQIHRNLKAQELRSQTGERHAAAAERLGPAREFQSLTNKPISFSQQNMGAKNNTKETQSFIAEGRHLDSKSVRPEVGATVGVRAGMPTSAEERVILGEAKPETTTEAKEKEFVRPVSGIPTPTPATTAIQQGVEAAKAATPVVDIPRITINTQEAPSFTATYAGRTKTVDNTPTNPAEQASTSARRAVATSMFDVMAGSLRTAGVDPNDSEVKEMIHHLTDGLAATNGPAQVAKRWAMMGVPQVVQDALVEAGKTVKFRDVKPLAPQEMADRSVAFLKEFHDQLDTRVRELPVSTEREQIQNTVNRIAKRLNTVAPGSVAMESVSVQPTEPTPKPPRELMSPKQALAMTRNFVEQLIREGDQSGTTSRGDEDRVWARVIEKHFMELPSELRDFWLGRPARDQETGQVHRVGINDESSDGEVHGTHIHDLKEEVFQRDLEKSEAPNAQAGERSTGTEATQQEGAQPSAERTGLQEGNGAIEAPGVRSDEANGKPGGVLAEDRPEAKPRLTPEQRAAKLEASKALLRGEYGVDDVKSLHEEAVDMIPAAPEEKWRGTEAGARRSAAYGPTQLLYPTESLAGGKASGMKRVLNLTDESMLSPEFAHTLGFDLPGHNMAAPGGWLWAQLAHPEMAGAKEHVLDTLHGLGFDGVAYTSGKGAVEVSPIHGEATVEALPAGRKSVSTPANGGRVWEKKADGSWGWRERVKEVSEPYVKPLSRVRTEAEAEAEAPVKITQPIADKVQRDQAVEDGQTLYATHHLSAIQLLELARNAGVPLDGKTWQRMLDRYDVESGMGTTRQLAGMDRRDDYSGKRVVHVPGVFAEKVVALAKDGGLSFLNADGHPDSMSVLGSLWRDGELRHDINTKKRYARDQWANFSRLLFGPNDIIESDRKAYASRDRSGIGSNQNYNRAREVLNNLIIAPKTYSTVIDQMNRELASGQVSARTADVMALAAATLHERNPNFFSRDAAQITERQQRDMAKDTYISQHFDPIREEHESFMTEDAPTDPRGNNFVEPENAPVERDGQLAFEPVVHDLVEKIAERGGFTPESMSAVGIEPQPKPRHKDTWVASVNEVHADPKAMATLEHNGKARLASPEYMHSTPGLRQLVDNGYAHTRLLFEAGKGKKEFHIDAFNVDPGFTKYYTAGEDLVAKLNFGTPDGLPVESHILTTREIGILLDSGHSMYNQTVEAVAGRIVSDGNVILAGTPMHRIYLDTPTGKVSQLVPRERMVGESYSTIPGTVTTLTGRQAPATTQLGREASQLVSRNQQLAASRMIATANAIHNGEADFAQHLGDSLLDTYITANTILKAVKDAKGGNFDMIDSIPEGPTYARAQEALADPKVAEKLEQFVKSSQAKLEKAESSESVAARARARDIMDALNKAKSDIPWDGIFNGSEHPVSFPTIVAQDSVRNKEQFIKVAEDMGISGADPETKFIHQQLSKINDIFFEKLGTSISQDPHLDSGVFNVIHRTIKIAGRMKSEGRPATAIARTMMHEFSHAMTAYMSIPMQLAADKWFRAERDLFIRQQSASSKSGRSILGDVLNADTVHVNPLTGEGSMSVSDALHAKGSMSMAIITPEAFNELVENHGQAIAASTNPVTTDNGVLVGHQLQRSFFTRDTYKYANLAEFIAETMERELANHARQSRGRKLADPYSERLAANAGAKTAMDAVHYSTGQLIDVVAGKNTMRRFVGYLVNQGGLLEKGLREGGIYTPEGVRDIAFPQMAFQGNDAMVFNRGDVQGGPPIRLKPQTADRVAREDHKLAEHIGWAMNYPRAMIMKAFNASSVSDKSRVASYALRQVLGELGTNYHTVAANMHKFYDSAHGMTVIDPAVRKSIIKAAEASNEAGLAKATGFSRVAEVKGSDGKTYHVHIDEKGRYLDAISDDLVSAIDSFEKTGEFSGKLQGLGKPLKQLNDFMWSGMSHAVANLSEKLDVPAEQMSNFDQLVTKVPNYLVHQYAPRTQASFIERAMGKRMGKEGGAAEMAGHEGLGGYNTTMDPTVDFGINAHMLLERKYGTMREALEHGYFPAHANVVENIVSGMSNTLGVIARINAVSAMLENGLAVPGYDGNPSTKTNSWGNLQLNTVGLTNEMFGKSLAEIRIHSDAARVLDYAFRPNFLARSSVGRSIAMLGGIMNVTQLLGANDYINGLATVAGFHASNVESLRSKFETQSKTAQLLKRSATLAAVGLGATAAGVVAGPAAATAGAVATYIGIKGLRTMIRSARPMAAGTIESIKEARRMMGVVQSPEALHPERLPQRDREMLAFLQASNAKIPENPLQIERFSKLVGEAMRRNKPLLATGYALTNLFNKPQLWNDIGTSGKILKKLGFENAHGFGGKALAKLGMIGMIAPAIMDKYRLKTGEVDWTNPELRREAAQLSDDMDYQVGAVQGKNLSMNPTVMSTMGTLFRAYNFRFTTEKMKMLVAADIVNNIGTSLPFGVNKSYEAFRQGATGGGTARPTPEGDSRFAWRKGTLAMVMLFLGAAVANRLKSMMSHVLWPDANYTMSDFARESVRQTSPYIGEKPALAFRGLLTTLPPEGSSTYEALRHIMYESIAPQLGHNDPTTGRPTRMAMEGTMYARNLVEHPLAASTDLRDQAEAISSWFSSGLNPSVSSGVDITRGKDALGRPVGWGSPFTHIGALNAYNQYFEKQPEDGVAKNLAKASMRSAAYLVSNSMPFFVRDAAEYHPGGSWLKSASQALGGRAMPQESSMTLAEAAAFEKRYTGTNPNQTVDSVYRNTLMRPAKVEMSETGEHTILDRLLADGKLGDNPKEAEKLYRAKLHEFVGPDGEPRPPIVRHLRGVMDKDKGNLKEIWLLANPKQREQIWSYINEKSGSGRDKVTRDRIDRFKSWIQDQGD